MLRALVNPEVPWIVGLNTVALILPEGLKTVESETLDWVREEQRINHWTD